FFFSSRRRHTRSKRDWSSDVCSSDLGFVKKEDVPMGEFRWITLVSSDEEDGTELLLEPNNHPAAKEYQKKISADGIPATMFGVKIGRASCREREEVEEGIEI